MPDADEEQPNPFGGWREFEGPDRPLDGMTREPEEVSAEGPSDSVTKEILRILFGRAPRAQNARRQKAGYRLGREIRRVLFDDWI